MPELGLALSLDTQLWLMCNGQCELQSVVDILILGIFI